jgi:hypothetical protein
MGVCVGLLRRQVWCVGRLCDMQAHWRGEHCVRGGGRRRSGYLPGELMVRAPSSGHGGCDSFGVGCSGCLSQATDHGRPAACNEHHSHCPCVPLSVRACCCACCVWLHLYLCPQAESEQTNSALALGVCIDRQLQVKSAGGYLVQVRAALRDAVCESR